jgi:hypothetical protein
MITAMLDSASARFAGPARQCNRQRWGPGAGPPESIFCGGSRSVMPSDAGGSHDPVVHAADTIAGQADRRRPITSLDQLYTQAMGVAPVLCTHCAAWATESGGCFHQADARPGSSGIGGTDEDCALSALPQVLRTLVQCGNVKRPQRAMEKALTCYGGDVSRLLDVCRGRVVFGDAGPPRLRAGDHARLGCRSCAAGAGKEYAATAARRRVCVLRFQGDCIFWPLHYLHTSLTLRVRVDDSISTCFGMLLASLHTCSHQAHPHMAILMRRGRIVAAGGRAEHTFSFIELLN